MPFLFSPSKLAFYLSSGTNLPADATVPVSDATHDALMAAQAAGQVIAAGANGAPIAVANTPPAPTFSVAAVNSECQRRIYAVASANTQMNVTAYIASGVANAADEAAFKDAVAWIAAMRAAAQALVAAQDATFAADGHWPACPADVVALAARF